MGRWWHGVLDRHVRRSILSRACDCTPEVAMARLVYHLLPICCGAALFLLLIGSKAPSCVPATPTDPVCAAPTDCEGLPHVDCNGAWDCQAGACVWSCGPDVPPAECKQDSDCGPKMKCHQETIYCIKAPCPQPPPKCVPLDWCAGVSDCNGLKPPYKCLGNWACKDQVCTYACGGPTPASCQEDADCAPSEACTCQPDPSCPMCDVCLMQCTAKPPSVDSCKSDGSCPDGSTCVNGLCQKCSGICTAIACPPGTVKNACCQCVPKDPSAECTWDADCGSYAACVAGKCEKCVNQCSMAPISPPCDPTQMGPSCCVCGPQK